MPSKEDWELEEYKIASGYFIDGCKMGLDLVRTLVLINAALIAGIVALHGAAGASHIIGYAAIFVAVLGLLMIWPTAIIAKAEFYYLGVCSARAAELEKKFGGQINSRILALDKKGEGDEAKISVTALTFVFGILWFAVLVYGYWRLSSG